MNVEVLLPIRRPAAGLSADGLRENGMSEMGGRTAWVFRRRVIVALGGLVIGSAGCGQHVPHSGKSRADVVVKVMFGGQPVTAGDVDLNNLETGEGGGGALDHTGTARIPGVVLGDYTVTVLPPLSSPIPGENAPAAKIPPIDRKFQSPEKSPLKLSVPAEGREIAFDLKP